MTEAPVHPAELELDSVPEDVAFAIAASLSARDLCSLGSCSRFWSRLSASNFLWSSLSASRWPLTAELRLSSSSQEAKADYIRHHHEIASKFSNIITFVNQCSHGKSLEVTEFLKAVADLNSMNASFIDIQMFLLTTKQDVLLNIIGLHYLIFSLGVPTDRVLDILENSKLTERKVQVNWFKLGRWFYGFRLPDEFRSRKITLLELVTSEEEVRSVLNRGILHEVLRVQVIALAS